MQSFVAATANYRPDVDGLRAGAVLAVVLYHAFPTSLTGGFVGVDVFFVISGFLISSIIFDKLAAGTFTVKDFYVRRVRRILPALTVMVLAVLAFGYVVLVKDEYVQLGKHVVSAAVFLSNITLYQESGYFDLAVETKPLLHLWSLGVEEQFYLVWPLLVALFWRRRWSVMGLVAVLGVASFAANLLLVRSDPSAAFFLPVSRFWELMAGGALA
jgi:peptidoglycan/LPS O-acetylase OafA/YrhL